MTAPLPTAAKLLTDLRRAGVVLSVNGDRLAFDAPAGAMTPAVVATLKARKPELLAVLSGDYLSAAAALLVTIADPDQRAELAYLFDERAGICQYDGGMSRGEAERIAYRDLARRMDPAADGVALPSETPRQTPGEARSDAWATRKACEAAKLRPSGCDA